MRTIRQILLLLTYNLLPATVVHSNDVYATTTTTTMMMTTTNLTNHLKIDDIELVNTLAYNKSGNINALSWRWRHPPTSTTTVSSNRTTTTAAVRQYQNNQNNYVLVAASMTTYQVWNGTIIHHPSNYSDHNSNDTAIIQWGIIQLIPSTDIARAVAFSPNGKWLALGNNDGTVQIWSVGLQRWDSILKSTIELDGNIRSLSWHPSLLLLGIAGIKFGFAIIDGNRNWTITEVERRSSSIPRVPDTLVHFIDWSPFNAFVVDKTIYEIISRKNIFKNTAATSTAPIVSRAIGVLDACRLCTLSQWSPDGQFIATAFGNEISISQVTTNATGHYIHWESIQNVTTVTDTYMIITAMVWSPNGKYLAVGGAGNNHLFVYDTSSWSEKPILIPTFSGFGIDTLAWRPDSEQIAIGTSRWIEIREIRWKVRDAIPSPPTQISYYPSASPSDRSTLISDPPEVVPIIETRMGTAGMAGIGIASVVLSFSCVAFVFLQRLKYISKRKKKEKVTRPEHDEIGAIRDAENTMSEEDIDSSSPMDRVIAFSNRTKHPNSDNDDDDDYNW